MAQATIVDVNPTMFQVLARPTEFELKESGLTFLARLDRRWRRGMAQLRHRVRTWQEEREVNRIVAALEKLDDDELELLGITRAAR